MLIAWSNRSRSTYNDSCKTGYAHILQTYTCANGQAFGPQRYKKYINSANVLRCINLTNAIFCSHDCMVFARHSLGILSVIVGVYNYLQLRKEGVGGEQLHDDCVLCDGVCLRLSAKETILR